jgi:formate hydrogenlyase transcriptional activator
MQEHPVDQRNFGGLAQILMVHCGPALVQTADHQQLLQSFCTALVDNAGFPLAWFGIPERSGNSVRLIAQAGDQNGFVQHSSCLEIPALTALATGETQIIADISISPLAAPIKGQALKRGYSSVVSIPLKADGKVVGALTIYADDSCEFDEKTMRLLQQWSALLALKLTLCPPKPQQGQQTPDWRRSEFYLVESQRLAHIGSWSFTADGKREYWSAEHFNIIGCDPARGVPTIPEFLKIVHRDDRERVKRKIETMVANREGCDEKFRILHPERGVRVVRSVGAPIFEEGVFTRFAGTIMDITEEERLNQELERSEGYLAEAQRLSHTGSFGWIASSEDLYWSHETYRIFEYDPAVKPTVELVFERIHPDDRGLVRQVLDRASRERKPFGFEHRLLLPDGSVKYVHVVGHPSANESGEVEFVGAVTDITERKRAEQKIRQDEAELRQMIDLVPAHVLVMRADGTRRYENQAMRDYFGTSLEGVEAKDFYARFVHSDDVASGVLQERERAVAEGAAWEGELRLRRKDGEYRWFLIRSNPLRDEQGNVIRRYATATDIEDRKRAEERLQKENVALREEIDKASMFEEIVGCSPALKQVLARIFQVAPTDATVLLTGETGTGKELIARAIHKRSRRSAKAFVAVNCAAIPASLIGSELFGHEKGAFTGALQRRLGRFELAEGGTIFLDEVGELPPETQSALLRVLQEREFERIGGNRTIRADARVIAATNRDLKAAMVNGTFRSDLYYRLQVFPIEIGPLRERKEDIPLLVEYFIDRYASKMGKKIRSINRKSLEALRSYFWPGNIRELQNVIERAVIVSEGDVLSIDESWLPREYGTSEPATGALSKLPPDREKEIIEAVLAETRGRVSGPAGAARKLGVPSTTLESRIRSLKINKHRFKVLSVS